jgi:hypothetical protein
VTGDGAENTSDQDRYRTIGTLPDRRSDGSAHDTTQHGSDRVTVAAP